MLLNTDTAPLSHPNIVNSTGVNKDEIDLRIIKSSGYLLFSIAPLCNRFTLQYSNLLLIFFKQSQHSSAVKIAFLWLVERWAEVKSFQKDKIFVEDILGLSLSSLLSHVEILWVVCKFEELCYLTELN